MHPSRAFHCPCCEGEWIVFRVMGPSKKITVRKCRPVKPCCVSPPTYGNESYVAKYIWLFPLPLLHCSPNKSEFMKRCESSYSSWKFSGGFRTWVKMSLVKTKEEDGRETVEFRQEVKKAQCSFLAVSGNKEICHSSPIRGLPFLQPCIAKGTVLKF